MLILGKDNNATTIIADLAPIPPYVTSSSALAPSLLPPLIRKVGSCCFCRRTLHTPTASTTITTWHQTLCTLAQGPEGLPCLAEAPVSLPLDLICMASRLPVNVNGTTVIKGHSYSSRARQYMILFHTMPDPLLSTLKIHNAIVCLTKSPANPQAVCIPKSCHASMSSRIGPNQTSQRFRMVRLLVVAIRLVSGSMVIWRTRNFAMMVKIAVSSWEGGLSPGHTVTLGSNKPVLALNFGNL